MRSLITRHHSPSPGSDGRVGLLALTILLLLAMAGEALSPVIVAAEPHRHRQGQDAGVVTGPRPEALRERERSRNDVNAEVVGGQPVAQGTFTFMTLVRINVGSGFLRCGGSLIAPRFVLTAAHCVEDSPGDLFDPDQFVLIIGRAFWPDFTDENVRGVVSVTQHPQWDGVSEENDVAVLELDAPVPAGIANPLALVSAGQTQFDAAGEPVVVAGWGRTSFGGAVSDQLRAADLNVVSNSSCANAYGDDFVQAVMICAAFQGRDSCQGDSGGPLFAREVIGFDVKKKKKKKKGKKRKVIRTPIFRDIQVGIVSFGEGCADPDFPGVYTRVSAPGINDFIVDVIHS